MRGQHWDGTELERIIWCVVDDSIEGAFDHAVLNGGPSWAFVDLKSANGCMKNVLPRSNIVRARATSSISGTAGLSLALAMPSSLTKKTARRQTVMIWSGPKRLMPFVNRVVGVSVVMHMPRQGSSTALACCAFQLFFAHWVVLTISCRRMWQGQIGSPWRGGSGFSEFDPSLNKVFSGDGEANVLVEWRW
jgi:hypothetical protein